MTRQAVIDVGTNSVKFHVAEPPAPTGPGARSRTAPRSRGSAKGSGRAGEIAPDAIQRTAEAIEGMAAEAARLGADGVTAVGTMGLRTAANSQAFLDLVKEQCGVAIEVISGQDESRIAYLAVQSGLGLADADLVIFDTGGGSTQFTFGHGTRVDRQFSLDLGAVRLTEQFHLDQAVSAEELGRALEAIAGELSAIDGVPSPDGLVGMGGAMTNLTSVMLGLPSMIRTGSRGRCWNGRRWTGRSNATGPSRPRSAGASSASSRSVPR